MVPEEGNGEEVEEEGEEGAEVPREGLAGMKHDGGIEHCLSFNSWCI
jgi:hypothetical protein